MCATYAPRNPIREFWQGDITLRELRVLVEGLPPDSARHRADPELAGWTSAHELMAKTFDGVAALFNLTLAANSDGGRYEPPEPLPRPGTDAWREAVIEADPELREERDRSAKAFMQGVLDKLLPGGK